MTRSHRHNISDTETSNLHNAVIFGVNRRCSSNPNS